MAGSPFTSTRYGRIAKWYDWLERLSGGVIEKTRNAFLGQLPFAPQNPLIIGCGTGKFVAVFLRSESPPRLTLNDIAPEMLSRSRERARETRWHGELRELPGDIMSLQTSARFDWISLQFVLNCFSFRQRHAMLTRVQDLLAPGGVLYICDYSKPRRPWMLPLFYLNYWASVAVFWPLANNRPNFPGDNERVIFSSGLQIVGVRRFAGQLYSAWLTRVP